MILDAATLVIVPGQEGAFEAAFEEAKKLIISAPGYISHELQRCIELPDRYILLVRWQTLEHHTVGFMQSFQYQKWCALLQHFFDPSPSTFHYAPVGRKIYRGF